MEGNKGQSGINNDSTNSSLILNTFTKQFIFSQIIKAKLLFQKNYIETYTTPKIGDVTNHIFP